jgi:(2S)-methylsuccinyl-CoA dehydrogenase
VTARPGAGADGGGATSPPSAGWALAWAREAATALHAYLAAARWAFDARHSGSSAGLGEDQRAAHGFAWLWSYGEALEATLDWAENLEAEGLFGRTEALLLAVGFGEFLGRILGGIPMSASEFARPADLGIERAALRLREAPSIGRLLDAETARGWRRELAERLTRAPVCESLRNPVLDAVRDSFRSFTDAEIAPHAQGWHLADALLPSELIAAIAQLGAFGVGVPTEFGGAGLGTLATAVVSEALSRGALSAGSLGTRCEIAAQLLLSAGTPAQKAKHLPAIVSGDTLVAAVFTEPGAGSDLANVATRAVPADDARGHRVWRLFGAKTWITHAARADLMVVLARTGSPGRGHRGLSLFLAEKPRGEAGRAFPSPGLEGGEIPVLGYRGMREYELAFDGFEIPFDGLLGDAGEGFRLLMPVLEAARIQTAARALGVAQAAFEAGLAHAQARSQFGRPLMAFPRVHDKLAVMAAEIVMVRQLTHRAARRKDSGRRSDIEAGMAKLLAAAAAWSAADGAVQIHGGAGYALEHPVSRLLCDARVLSIFEGAAEVQADVIARGALRAG